MQRDQVFQAQLLGSPGFAQVCLRIRLTDPAPLPKHDRTQNIAPFLAGHAICGIVFFSPEYELDTTAIQIF